MSLSSDKELGELSSGDSDVDDLFNSYNKYYTASFSSPQCSPISSKYTGVPTRFQYTEPRRSPESQLHEFQALEIGQGTFSEQDTLQEQWLTEFGKEKYQLPSNLNIFSKQQIRERWVQFWDKLRETEKSVLQGMKRGRWNEISNEFTDFKAIKMANLAFLTGKESDGVKLPVVQPGNYLENKFTFLAFINSPGYAEYIFDYYQKYHPSFQVQALILPQSKFFPRLHNSQLQIQWQSKIQLLNKLQNDQFNQQSLQELVQSINNSNVNMNLILGIKSINHFDLETFTKIESTLNPFLFGYLVLATQCFNQAESLLILKFYTAFTAKTCEFLFLLYVLFEQVIFFRPVTSFVLSNEKFIICQNFHCEIAKQLKDTLIENFDDYLLNQEHFGFINIENLTQDIIFVKFFEIVNQIFLGKFLVKLQEITQKGEYSSSQNEIINSQLYKWKLSFAQPPQNYETNTQNFQQMQRQYQYQSQNAQHVPKFQIYESQQKNTALENSKHLYAQKDLIDFLGKKPNQISKQQNKKFNRGNQLNQSEKAMKELTDIFENKKHFRKRPPKK